MADMIMQLSHEPQLKKKTKQASIELKNISAERTKVRGGEENLD